MAGIHTSCVGSCWRSRWPHPPATAGPKPFDAKPLVGLSRDLLHPLEGSMTIRELFAREGFDYPQTGRGFHRTGIPVEILMAFLVAEVTA